VTLQGALGYGPAIALQLSVLAILWWITGRASRPPPTRLLIAVGLDLTVRNAATLLFAGRPWGVISAYALWGSKLATMDGFDAHGWAYWTRPKLSGQLDQLISLDVTSMMNAAIVLGATCAAAFGGAFHPRAGGMRPWAGALLGGVAMGFGARLANGCNIGAYFSAISAGDLSGWVWVLLALGGSWFGVRLRPPFGLRA